MLYNRLEASKSVLRKFIVITENRYDKLMIRLNEQLKNPKESFYDEEIWTFLLACGYAAGGQSGSDLLIRKLSKNRCIKDGKIFIEWLPVSPREARDEGKTHVDLAIGNIKLRQNTKGGIELEVKENSFINFCEAKWYSDIPKSVTYDQARNQLIRIIDNAICFQKEGKYADKIMVTLITPEIFKSNVRKSRLYQYKFEDYLNDKNEILEDLDLNQNRLKFRQNKKWKYPDDIPNRLKNLELNWISYEELFYSMPNSNLKDEILKFEKNYNKSSKLR